MTFLFRFLLIAVFSHAVTAFATQKNEDKKKAAIPDGKYYHYAANYKCLKKGNVFPTPSYSESYSVEKGVICRTGDGCVSTKSQCVKAIANNMKFSADHSTLTVDGSKVFIKQDSEQVDSCWMPACAYPDEICRFAESAPLDEKGCPMGCGTIICKPNLAKDCPELNCAAAPQRCSYDGNAPVGKDGCPLGCGNLVCDTIERKEFKCPAITCAKPPENCFWKGEKYDERGCQSTCGQLSCGRIKGVKTKCPQEPKCAEAPTGCHYVGEPATDKDGCRIGCGGLVCAQNFPSTCKKPPSCPPPGENCRYVGNGPLDFEGCPTGCGNRICTK